jgi:hypothetical protein
VEVGAAAHPVALVREGLRVAGACTAEDLLALAHGTRARVAGLVLVRQRPGTASGVTFVTVEDETGVVNLVVWKRIAQRDRRALLGSRLLWAEGEVQREGAREGAPHPLPRGQHRVKGEQRDRHAHGRQRLEHVGEEEGVDKAEAGVDGVAGWAAVAGGEAQGGVAAQGVVEGAEVVGGTPEDFARHIKVEHTRIGKMIADGRLKMN